MVRVLASWDKRQIVSPNFGASGGAGTFVQTATGSQGVAAVPRRGANRVGRVPQNVGSFRAGQGGARVVAAVPKTESIG